jgi:hypothetical protein
MWRLKGWFSFKRFEIEMIIKASERITVFNAISDDKNLSTIRIFK